MAGEVRTRRDVWGLSSPDPWHPTLLAYARAVQAMQQRPRTDARSWAYQAAVHGTTEAAPRGARWNECKHGSWFFLPWHRLYLDHFERIVRAVVVEQGGDEDWALPYWNIEAPGASALPPAFRARTLPGGSTPNPLFVAQRAPGINTGGRLPVASLASSRALAARTYMPPPGAGFGGGRSGPVQFFGAAGDLERTPHNDMHVIIGGTGLMGDPNRAALDPIFWLHHANIDRLWSEWIVLADGRANPTDRTWRNQRFPFADERGTIVQRTVNQSLSTQALGYTYDTLADDELPAAPAAAARSGGPTRRETAMELVGASDAPVRLVGATARVDVDIDRRAAESFAAGNESVTPARVYLALEDIEGDRNPGIVYEVHLVSTRRGAVPGDRHVGNVSFFGIEHVASAGGDDAHGMRHVYDVTDLVGGLGAGGDWTREGVRVEFRPLGLLSPADADDADDSDGSADDGAAELPASPIPVSIGRVSLFFE
ncbi:MAG: probable oxidoreductase protein [uncultured Acidimicrobiales bacterium]|uniref:Probable oxidoreductase protein n=1 Tax=uncultured Acidimicrobiales bacterium TaxID=310071 RepID=A0A6J4HUK3_9ACTN|nr:MAG: probable oxidoreductase protein [uncultured Acidimicrobiales bacterium]